MPEQDDNKRLLEDIVSTLHSIENLLQFYSRDSIKGILEESLNTDEKRAVYNLMDGEKSVRDIELLTEVNKSIISSWGQEWEKLGIVENDLNSKVKGRRKKRFELSGFGLTLQIPKNEN